MTVHDPGGALDSIGIKETRVTQSTRAMLLHLPHEIQIESQVVDACDPEELQASRRQVLLANALLRCAPLVNGSSTTSVPIPERALRQHSMNARRGT